MSLDGNLRVFSLTEILQMLGMQRKTGILTVEGPKDTITLGFSSGNVVSVESSSNPIDNRLGALLRQGGPPVGKRSVSRPRESEERGRAARKASPAPGDRPSRGPAGGAPHPDSRNSVHRFRLGGRTFSVRSPAHRRSRRGALSGARHGVDPSRSRAHVRRVADGGAEDSFEGARVPARRGRSVAASSRARAPRRRERSRSPRGKRRRGSGSTGGGPWERFESVRSSPTSTS